MPTVAFSRRLEDWIVRGERRKGGVNGELVLMRDELAQIAAVDIRNALAKNASFYDTDPCDADVSDVPEGYFDPEDGGGEIGFQLVGSALIVSIIHFAQWPANGDEQAAIAKVRDLVTPFLNHKRAKLHSVEVEDTWSTDMALAIRLRVATPLRGRTAAELLELGDAALRLCDSFSSSAIDRDSVADLVRGGCAELLIGQPEGNWLDAKAEEYELTTTHGKISLAQAVSRFCNGEDGGLIVIGAKAKKIPGGEEIRQARGVIPKYADTVARYQRVLDQHLYPPVMGLRIDLVPTIEGRSIISPDIPPQPEEFKPFLVHGAITADGETEGAFISIVQRRGEGSIPITAPTIHSTLAAGRALLRGAVNPGKPPKRQ